MTTKSPVTRKTNRRWQWLLLVMVIALSFACVFCSAQVALMSVPERAIGASMLSDSRVSYQIDGDDQVVFAPLDPDVMVEATRDAGGLQITLIAVPGANASRAVAQLPATPTPSATALVNSESDNTATPTPVDETPGLPTNTPIPPSRTPIPPTATYIFVYPTLTPIPPTATDRPVQPTDTPLPATNTAIPTSNPATNTPSVTPSAPPSTQTPSATTTPTPTTTQGPSTATIPPTSSPSPTATPTFTPVPSATNTPTSTPTGTSTPTSTSTPTDSPTGTNTPTNTPDTRVELIPILECVEPGGSLGYIAHFGYQNDNAVNVIILIGSNNMFTPPPNNRGQPTTFLPGRQTFIFSVDFDGSQINWKLDSTTIHASDTSPACP